MSSTTHEIQQVIARYGSTLDAHDHDALAGLHRVEAEWTFAIGSQVVIGPLRGRDAIIDFVSRPPDGPPVQQRHVLTNISISGTSNETTRATAYLTLIAAHDAAPVIVATGTATFVLRVTEGMWSIETLLISFDNSPLPH
ncbi:nuclear transport factor 2 family protein [Curtobacterium sp. VKM Ac-1376]|uniref:nuclear transport factor 2 family protein n=1 Tax=Curtobacterium sp. VKM Ac-1376 TaxID=123312 RepID=UPI00188A2798|nr:nuclear transport factor 2 family protein [Curtobacterium sp. VKM Ac-1376]MBF4615902.1 nuclear transport factor 2 family protein [Curtobacterium sp. VKM Ac-1376]